MPKRKRIKKPLFTSKIVDKKVLIKENDNHSQAYRNLELKFAI